MTSKSIHNEQVKIASGFLTTIGFGLIGAGFINPAIAPEASVHLGALGIGIWLWASGALLLSLALLDVDPQ